MRLAVLFLVLVHSLCYAQIIPDPNQDYVIVNARSFKCLDTYGNSKRPGGEVYQWQYWQGEQQYFRIIPTDSGFYKIQSSRNGLHVASYNSEKGRSVVQMLNQRTHLQQWSLEWIDSVHFWIVNRSTGLCLDVKDRSTKSRAPIVAYPKLKRKSQLWMLYPKEEINLIEADTTLGEPEKLSESINSVRKEVYPVVSPDGTELFVCRKEMPESDSSGRDDIFHTTLTDKGVWGELIPFPKPLNNPYHNFVCSITPDGNSILLGTKYTSDGRCLRGASMSVKTDTGWCYPRPLEIHNFKNRVKWGGYFLGNDRKTLLMAVGGDSCYGSSDIYVSFLNDDETWTSPRNLGPVINTPFAENTPFLAADGKTMYFASNGHPGYGHSDIFVTRRLDDTWTNWSKPVNIGKPFNTPKWDAYFTIPASGEYAYFVSEIDPKTKGDIYRSKLPSALRPEPVLLIHGRVLDKETGKPLEGRVICNQHGGDFQAQAISNSDGYYKLVLPAGKRYEVLAQKENYASESNYKTTDIEAYGEKEVDLYLVPFKKDQVLVLNNLFFNPDRPQIMKESFPELDRLYNTLKNTPSLKIEIGGHTDSMGSDAYNQKLSDRRASGVYHYLVEKGISPNRISYKGYGESTPVATNETDEGRALNRRVEVKFLTGF